MSLRMTAMSAMSNKTVLFMEGMLPKLDLFASCIWNLCIRCIGEQLQHVIILYMFIMFLHFWNSVSPYCCPLKTFGTTRILQEGPFTLEKSRGFTLFHQYPSQTHHLRRVSKRYQDSILCCDSGIICGHWSGLYPMFCWTSLWCRIPVYVARPLLTTFFLEGPKSLPVCWNMSQMKIPGALLDWMTC